MDNLKPLVIVLSRNYSTGLGVIRSLGETGYTVDLIASVKKKGSSVIASSSKYVRRCTEVHSSMIQGDSGEGIIDVLMEYTKEYDGEKVLFPADDFTTSVVDKNREALSEHFLMPEIKSDAGKSITDFMDKKVQSQVAESAGLLTPHEWMISIRDEIAITDDIIYPCFVKPVQSFAGHKTEMAVCNNEVELYSHLLEMQSFYSDRDVLVQEYLNIDKEIDLSGVCIDQKVIIPAVIEKIRIAQYERGVTMAGRLVSVDTLEDIKDKIIKMLQQFHYTGMFDMELNVCGDKVYFNEVNFRSGGPNYSYKLNGVNLPDIFVKGITGCEITSGEEVMPVLGKTFVYEKVAWEDYIHGFISRKEMQECIDEADYTLLANDNDPAPGKIFYKRIRLSALKNKLRKKLSGSSKKASGIEAESLQDIVVTGRNYCNILTMTRGLGKAGYNVDVLRIYKKRPSRVNLLARMVPDAYSMYVKNFRKCIAVPDERMVIADLLRMADKSRKKLLIPVDDYSVCAVDDHLDKLSDYYEIPSVNSSQGEITRLMDKYYQKEKAAEFELPMLHSCLIKAENGAFIIPDDVVYPCFIKPNVSMKSRKSVMTKCNERSELEKTLNQYAQKEDFEMLVEEFAEIKQEYSVLGISTPEKTIAPCVFKVTEGGNKERKGVAVTGETVSCTPFENIIDECVKFIDSLGYTGIFDIDLLETEDGKIYFIEINFRAGASTHVFTETGINLPGMMADYFLKGKAIDYDEEPVAEGISFISEKVLIEEYARSDADMRKVRKAMEQADVYFIKDAEDTAPYDNFKKYYKVAGLMRIPYRMRERRKEKEC